MSYGEIIFISVAFGYLGIVLYLLYKQKLRREREIADKKKKEDIEREFMIFCEERIRGIKRCDNKKYVEDS